MPELQRKAGEIPVNISIRSLRADEINVRIDQCVEGKALLLLYIDSRACRKILDETFGMFGWRDHYEEIKGALYCTIELWDETKSQWIPKQDCGTASNTEKTKGEASDAFKRACFCAGIGRELYTKIPIWINRRGYSSGVFRIGHMWMTIRNGHEMLCFPIARTMRSWSTVNRRPHIKRP